MKVNLQNNSLGNYSSRVVFENLCLLELEIVAEDDELGAAALGVRLGREDWEMMDNEVDEVLNGSDEDDDEDDDDDANNGGERMGDTDVGDEDSSKEDGGDDDLEALLEEELEKTLGGDGFRCVYFILFFLAVPNIYIVFFCSPTTSSKRRIEDVDLDDSILLKRR